MRICLAAVSVAGCYSFGSKLSSTILKNSFSRSRSTLFSGTSSSLVVLGFSWESPPRSPAGDRLPYRFTNEEDGKVLPRYWTTACSNCSLKCQCKTGSERQITRWEHEHLLYALIPTHSQRRETVEHPFGTIKAAWATHFLTKTLPK